jgi:hypothetical protein
MENRLRENGVAYVAMARAMKTYAEHAEEFAAIEAATKSNVSSDRAIADEVIASLSESAARLVREVARTHGTNRKGRRATAKIVRVDLKAQARKRENREATKLAHVRDVERRVARLGRPLLGMSWSAYEQRGGVLYF